jgi:hypothetical protein
MIDRLPIVRPAKVTPARGNTMKERMPACALYKLLASEDVRMEDRWVTGSNPARGAK